MKVIIQRVLEAKVEVDEKVTGEIGKGFLIFLGVGKGDTEEIVDKYIKKIIGLRIFEDDKGKTNLALGNVQGEILVVSQFTLYANCKKGNRPSFVEAGEPALAEELYNYAIKKLKEEIRTVESGVFGADMKVSLINDGPFTVILGEEIISS